MASKLNDRQVALIKAKNFAFVGTLMPDGSPQVSPMWVEYDGEHVVLNSEVTRAKVKNMQRDPRVTVCVSNHENAYEYLEIRGRVVAMSTEGAFEGIDMLSKKYLGEDKYPGNQPGDQRITIKVEPSRVVGYTGS
jgi:PPOX class probable F420-dependent enzyme